MKKSELRFNLISIAVDFLMLILAAASAYYARIKLAPLRPIIYDLNFPEYLETVLAIAPILIFAFALAGLYNLKGTRRITNELLRILLATSSGLLVVVIIFFFDQTVFPSRLIILMSWILAIVLVSLGRVVLRLIQIRLFKKGIGLHRLVVVGQKGNGEHKLVGEIKKRPELGYKVIGALHYAGQPELLLKELEKIRRQHGMDEVLQADPQLPREASALLLQFCRDYGVLFNFVPDIFGASTTNVGVETLSGIPIVVLKGTPLEGWGRVIKRLLDLLISFLGLLVLSPVFLFVAAAIKISSRGPVFFHQPRAAGLGQFECFKFRTMYQDMSEGTESGDKLRAELERQNSRLGPFVKIKNDPRVTPLGRFLRRTKLDEMPQLWHILRGQMSLVGPRVHMVKEVKKFQDDYKQIFTIKPGATGLTQITQVYNPELSFDEEIRLDTFYIENWSLWLDLYIIFKTVLILFGRRPKVDY